MNPLLPAPPATTDPLTWIALAGFAALLLLVLVGVPRGLAAVREDRAAMLAAADTRLHATLIAFREELAAERQAHREAVAALREDQNDANTRFHERLDRVDQRLVELSSKG